MKLTHLRSKEQIEVGIKSLTGVFIDEYPYYSTWIKNKEKEFLSFEKEVISIEENRIIVGYIMIHHCTTEYFKINGIYIFPEFEGKGYATQSIIYLNEEAKKQGNLYALIQTRLHNNAVVHMFDKIGFNIIGKNYHEIERKDNWVAITDLYDKRNYEEMNTIAAIEYPGFQIMNNDEIKQTREQYGDKTKKLVK